nr:IS66 family transposase [Nitrosomonas nitrosa]
MAPHIIDKGIPATGVLAPVLAAKYAAHLPHTARRRSLVAPDSPSRAPPWSSAGSTGVQLQPLVDAMRDDLLRRRVLHADETPVAVLDPGAGKTRRAYLWSYCSTSFDRDRLVVFDCAEGRAGRHAMEFLGHPGEQAWRGALVCDDYAGYKALSAQGTTKAGCLAHARRKFHELWANHKSTLAEQALALFAKLYEVEREVADLPAAERLRIRQLKATPAADAVHAWSLAQRHKVGSPRFQCNK